MLTTRRCKVIADFLGVLTIGTVVVGLTILGLRGNDRSYIAYAQQQLRIPGWGITHTPAANTIATITRAAVLNQRHVADCVSITFVAATTAPAAIAVQANLRDGASGAGTILQSWALALPATGGASNAPIELCGLALAGTINTAMTLEFTAAGGANTIEAVSLKGHDE